MQFDTMVSNYIRKNTDVLNIPKNSLCTDLFSFREGTPPALIESVRLHILNDIERIAPYIRVLKYYITGDCLVPKELPDNKCDVNVIIEFAGYKEDNISYQRAYDMCKKLSSSSSTVNKSTHNKHQTNKRYLDRTRHEIFYHLYDKAISPVQLKGIYDILNNKWVKVPDFEEDDL